MRKRVFNIVWRSVYGSETIDFAYSRAEAEHLIKEYQVAFNEGHVFIKRDLV